MLSIVCPLKAWTINTFIICEYFGKKKYITANVIWDYICKKSYYFLSNPLTIHSLKYTVSKYIYMI